MAALFRRAPRPSEKCRLQVVLARIEKFHPGYGINAMPD
jgi:hypothetical protein